MKCTWLHELYNSPSPLHLHCIPNAFDLKSVSFASEGPLLRYSEHLFLESCNASNPEKGFEPFAVAQPRVCKNIIAKRAKLASKTIVLHPSRTRHLC